MGEGAGARYVCGDETRTTNVNLILVLVLPFNQKTYIGTGM